MDDVNFFDKMDLKEVSKRTLLNVRDLEYLKNEEFDKLSKTKGLGFIKILEREYKVDLSDKKEKFLSYLKEHGKDKTKEFFIPPPKPPTKTFSKFILLILFLLIGAGVLYILYLNMGQDTSLTQATSDENRVVKEAQDISGIKVDETNTTQESVEEESIEKDLQPSSDLMEENASSEDTQEQESNTAINSDINSSKDETKKVSLQLEKESSNDKNSSTSFKNILTIVPKSKIWIGIIELKNHKKRSYLKDTNITIDIDDSYLIATGHGKLKLFYKGEILDFGSKSPMRFLVKDGSITQIDKKEFTKLNKGKYW